MTRRKDREVEKRYSRLQAAATLRRLADALEGRGRFRIQIGGERISIPEGAVITIEHEREGRSEEFEIQLSWERR